MQRPLGQFALVGPERPRSNHLMVASAARPSQRAAYSRKYRHFSRIAGFFSAVTVPSKRQTRRDVHSRAMRSGCFLVLGAGLGCALACADKIDSQVVPSGSALTAVETQRAWIRQGRLHDQVGQEPLGLNLAASGDFALATSSVAALFARTDGVWSFAQNLALANESIVLSAALTSDAAALTVHDGDVDHLSLYTPDVESGVWEPRQTRRSDELGYSELDAVALSQDWLVLAAQPTVEQHEIVAFPRQGQALGPPSVVYSGEEILDLTLAIAGEYVLLGEQFARAPNGSEGVVRLYSFDAGWTEWATLQAPESSAIQFGFALSATAERLAVTTRTGQVYVFERDGAGFDAGTLIEAPEPVNTEARSVAVSDIAVLVGLPELSPPDVPRVGAAYMAFSTREGWSKSAWLERDLPLANELFGYTVALATGNALVSRPYVNRPSGVGEVLVYGPCASDLDCVLGEYCDNQGACATQKATGEPCDPQRECLSPDCQLCESSHCSDGFCCESACDDSCQACDGPEPGECRAVEGQPRGTRAVCAGEDDTCAGACDGQHSGCVYPSAQTPCASECSEGIAMRSVCDGLGSCLGQARRACGGYACSGDVCGTTCQDHDDCAPGFGCVDATCTPIVASRCSADRNAAVGGDGTTRECTPYLCDEANGSCASACLATSDCSEGYVCEERSRACVVESARPRTADGCDCRLVPPSASTRFGWLALGLIALSRRGWKRRP